MIIGLDIDDVIYQTGEMVKRLLTDFDGLDASTKMEIMRGTVVLPVVKKFWEDNFLTISKEDKIVEGAVEGISKLRKRHKVILVTARGDEHYPGIEKVMKEMLAKDGVEYDGLVFNSLDKAVDCERLGVELFVDDSPRNCLEVMEKLKIPVVGFASEITRDELKRKKIFSVDNWADLEKAVAKIADGEKVAGV